MTTDSAENRVSWRGWAILWLSLRLIAAVFTASIIFSWLYNYWYQALAFDNLVTSLERFGQFQETLEAMFLCGCVPAAITVFIELSGRYRTWKRTILAAVAPNVVCSIGIWVVLSIGGLSWWDVFFTFVIAGLGSLTFVLALSPRTPLRKQEI